MFVVLTQDKNTIVNLEKYDKVQIQNKVCIEVVRCAKISKNHYQDVHETIATYDNEKQATQVLTNLCNAIEAKASCYRMPPRA